MTTSDNHDGVEEILKDNYEALVDEIRTTTDMEQVKASLYERMRAQRLRQTHSSAASPRAGERPLSEVRYLTVAEVSAVMRVSKMTVFRLVHSGELPAIRVGRSFRVPEQAVHDYLAEAFEQAGGA